MTDQAQVHSRGSVGELWGLLVQSLVDEGPVQQGRLVESARLGVDLATLVLTNELAGQEGQGGHREITGKKGRVEFWSVPVELVRVRSR